MKGKNLLPSLAITLFTVLCSMLQAQIKVEGWRDHLSYRQALHIADAGSRIYCATEGSLFYYDITDHTVNKLSPVQGLNDLEISTIGYQSSTGRLLIAYKDGNLDLIESKEITNIPDILNKSTLSDKTIYHILFDDSTTYLSCGFGIVALNLKKREVKDTYFIGENGGTTDVYATCTDGTYLYAATANGILKAAKDNPNLVNYAFWTKLTDIPRSTGKFNALVWFNNMLFVNSCGEGSNDDHLYYLKNNTWNEFNPGYPEGNAYKSLEVCNDHLVIASTWHVDVFDQQLNHIRHEYIGTPVHAITDIDNTIWAADNQTGLIRVTTSFQKDTILPNGPDNNMSFRVFSSNGKTYVAGGGVTSPWSNSYNYAFVHFFDQNTWSSWYSESQRDVVNVITNPSDKSQVFAGTWGYGVLEFKDNVLQTIYNPSNSTLQSIISGDNYCRVYGLAFDKDKNLWVANAGVSNPISIRLSDGTWKSLSYGSRINAPVLGKMIIDQNNRKWIQLPQGYGLFVFDDNGTLTDISDDDYTRFTITDEDGNTISTNVYDIAEDLDGYIWVGTSAGPAVYYNPSDVFESSGFYASQILIPRNDGSGLGDYLLSTETITSIAIDGANRKWFGTQSSGVYLMSSDGLKQIYHFTKENSPLLSNTINSISIDGTTGEVFFATEKGLVSFRSTATDANDYFGKVYVFPNPVRETYHGDITITGLAKDVNVKITDVAGNLVYETTSLGGQAIWDGKNFDGRRAATGVYLVFCTNSDGSQTRVTKFLFIH